MKNKSAVFSLVSMVIFLVSSHCGRAEVSPFQLSLAWPLQIFPQRYDIYGLRLNLIYGVNHDLTGIDVGLENECKGIVRGIQAGVMNMAGVSIGGNLGKTAGALQGVQAGVINMAAQMKGVQIGLLWNMAGDGPMMEGTNASTVRIAASSGSRGTYRDIERPPDLMLESDPSSLGEAHGLQIGILNNAGVMHGAQLSTMISSANECYGLQVGSFCSANIIEGCQLGIVNNSAGEMHGVQFALENVAVDMHGLQIGIINIAARMRGVQIGAFNYIRENTLPFMVVVNASF